MPNQHGGLQHHSHGTWWLDAATYLDGVDVEIFGGAIHSAISASA